MNNKHIILIFCLFLSIISCSNPPDSGNSNNNNTGKVTVLCQCKKGFISWSGPDQASAEESAKKNCESINDSATNCKVID